jgi:hypothetical protein
LLIAAWLALASFATLMGYSSASSGVPYLGVLRGWENEERVNEMALDIAVDEENIYIAGMYFEGLARYGPTLLIVSRDHGSVVCQRALVFDVGGLDRWTSLSLDINRTHVAVAGYYGINTEDAPYSVFFVAVYRKNCEFTGIVEIGRFRPGGFLPRAVVKFDDDGDIYLLVSHTVYPTEDEYTIVLYRLDQYLNIIAHNSYYIMGYSRLNANDMEVGDAVYVVGPVWQAGPEGMFLMEIDKNTLEVVNHTLLGDRRSLWIFYPSVVVDSDGYIYVASTALSSSPLAVGPILLKLDSDFNIVFTEANIMGFTPTHRDSDKPYAGLPFVGDLDVSDTQVFIVGGIAHEDENDGFVIVANKTDGNPFYFLKIVSREGNAYTGGARVNSAAHAVRVYGDCAYITGYAENYYLEYEPLNPVSTSTPVPSNTSSIDTLEEEPLIEKNFDREERLNPVFDRDVSPIKSNGFYGVLCMSPLIARSMTTSTTTSTVTSTTTETTTSTTTQTTTSTTTSLRTVTSTPTTTVTRFTTSTRTAVATRVETEYVLSTVYTTRVVEGTVTRYETITSVTTIPHVTTLTDTTTIHRTATATTTPTAYAAAQTTIFRNQTVQLTTTRIIQPEGMVPWSYLLLPFMPLLLFPPLVFASGRRLTITILEGAAAQQPKAHSASILNEHFKPSVGKIKRNGKANFINKDREAHELELYIPEMPGKKRVFTLKPGEKVGIKIREPGKYFFRLTTNPDKLGILEVE